MSSPPIVSPHPRLEEKPRSLAENKLYQPFGKALEFILCKDPKVLLCGPAGTGKTRVGCEKIHLCALNYPGCRILLLRQTRKSLTDTALVTLEEHVIPTGFKAKSGAKRGQRQSYLYPNGSEIVVGGLDNPDKIMSAEYDLIYVVEATETIQEDVEKLTTRLRNGKMPYQQLILDCNPSTPNHWLKQLCDAGEITLINASHEDNPRLFNHELGEWTEEGRRYREDILGKLTGARKDRLLHGKWIQPEGARFPQAVRDVQGFHLERLFPQGIPVGFKKWISIDYGLAAPYCCLWHMVAPDGNVYTYREDYEPGHTADLQAKRVVQLSPANEEYYAAYLDPAMWAQFPGHEKKNPQQINKSAADYYKEEFRNDPRFGPLKPGFNKARTIGFSTLDAMLNHENTSTPNWFIEHSCENLWRELEDALFHKNPAGVFEEDLDEKCDDHALTAAYYGLHTHLQLPRDAKDPNASIDPNAVLAARRAEQEKQSERQLRRTTRRAQRS